MNGLVLEGGGMRGLFTAGIIDVWMEKGIRFDGIIGVSAGATFGCNYKSHQPGRVIRYNIRFKNDPRYMGIGSLIKTGDYVNGPFSYHYMPLKLDIFDTETFNNDPSEFWVVATDVHTGEPHYKQIKEVNYESLEWIRASASLPILSKPVQLGTDYFLDGGISDSIPVRFFQQQGYNRNVVILTQPKGFKKKPTKLMPVFKATMRRYPAIIEAMKRRHEMYNDELEYITEQESLGNTLVIYPDDVLPIGRTSQNESKMRLIYEMGRKAGEATAEKVRCFVAP